MTLARKTFLLRWVLYGSGAIMLCAFCITKNPEAMRHATMGSRFGEQEFR